MRSSIVADAVVLSPRKEVRKLVAEQLKLKSVSNILTPETPDDGTTGGEEDEMTGALDRFPRALLVLDWDLGPEAVARVLGHNRRKFPGQLRPMLLLAGQVSEQVVATAAEYSVTQIFTEQLTPKNLAGRLAALLIGETLPSEIKKVLAEAATLRHEGDHKTAFTTLQKLWQKHPTNLRVKCEVAEALMNLDQWDKALKVLEGIDKAKPPYLRGVHLYGRCLMKLGRYDEAVAAMEGANLFNPNDVERLADIGGCLLQLDRHREAAAQFDRALAIDPSFRPAKIGKGQTQLMDGQVNEALALLRDVAGDLELASLFNTTAVLSMRRGRHEAGMSLYQSALKALGRDGKIQARLYFNMGVGYRRWGKPDKALGCFEQSLKLDPGYEKAREHAMLVSTPPAEKQPAARPLPKAAGADTSGLVDLSSLGGDLSKVLDDDDLEESLYD